MTSHVLLDSGQTQLLTAVFAGEVLEILKIGPRGETSVFDLYLVDERPGLYMGDTMAWLLSVTPENLLSSLLVLGCLGYI